MPLLTLCGCLAKRTKSLKQKRSFYWGLGAWPVAAIAVLFDANHHRRRPRLHEDGPIHVFCLVPSDLVFITEARRRAAQGGQSSGSQTRLWYQRARVYERLAVCMWASVSVRRAALCAASVSSWGGTVRNARVLHVACRFAKTARLRATSFFFRNVYLLDKTPHRKTS